MKERSLLALQIAAGALVGTVVALLALVLLRDTIAPPAPRRELGPPQPSALSPQPTPDPPTARTDGYLRNTQLELALETEARQVPGTVYIHVRTNAGEEAGVRADETVEAASLIKVPVMAAVHAAWRSGFLKRTPADEQRMRTMVTVSDNGAANALIDRIGMSQVNAWLAEQGYTVTRLRRKVGEPSISTRAGYDPATFENVTTAREMTRMLLAIARGELLDARASAEMHQLLLAQKRRTRIPAGLPPEVPVGNKTGTWGRLVHDVAFVEPPTGPTYAIAVLVTGAADEPASKAIARISRLVYERLKSGG
jgi:beta-lactamase class A